jgi:hypothetical protein
MEMLGPQSVRARMMTSGKKSDEVVAGGAVRVHGSPGQMFELP